MDSNLTTNPELQARLKAIENHPIFADVAVDYMVQWTCNSEAELRRFIEYHEERIRLSEMTEEEREEQERENDSWQREVESMRAHIRAGTW